MNSNRQPTSPHLTPEQLYTLLDNPAADNQSHAPAHLAACPACAEEFDTLRASLTNFRFAATGLAAANTPALHVPATPRRTASRSILWPASFATAAVLVAASAALVHSSHLLPGSAPPAPSAVTSNESDDALLEGIQRDLATSVPPPLAPLAVASPAPTSGRR
jgi:anti-sigma factor RsiW